MISRIHGRLIDIQGNLATIRLGDGASGHLCYDVMLPAFCALRLLEAIDSDITLLTYHFVESVGQGTTLIPRLAGFPTAADRQFFELFTTCKGVGNKRALRAMTLEPSRIAAAIADRDVAMLQTLPEIGKRMAETIVATLNGKVDDFLTPQASASAEKPTGKGKAAAGASPSAVPAGNLARQALEALVQLGEQRAAASTWIDQALRQEDRPADVQSLIARVYRIKAGG